MEWQGNRTNETVENRRSGRSRQVVCEGIGIGMVWFVREFQATSIEQGNTFKNYSNNS
jgi:hypothetical protein